MSNIVSANFGAVPSVFKDNPNPGVFGDVTSGVTQGFATVRYKGKVWKVKHQGAEHLWLGPDGQPSPSIEVVMVNASSAISKSYHEARFSEGQEATAPDCWSVNGIAPDAAAPKKQHTSCVACPKNAFGSRVNDSGKPAKACQDRRRVAIMPVPLLMKGIEGPFGGPLLLQVPPMSLRDLAAYQRHAQSLGFPYYAVVTRISFDFNVAYPKLVFSAIRALTNEEALKVIELAQDDNTQRMLNAVVDDEVATNDDAPTAAGFFEQPPAQAPQQQAPRQAPPQKAQQAAAQEQAGNPFAPQQQAKPATQAPQQETANPFATMGGSQDAPAQSEATETKPKRTRKTQPAADAQGGEEQAAVSAAPSGGDLDAALSNLFG